MLRRAGSQTVEPVNLLEMEGKAAVGVKLVTLRLCARFHNIHFIEN